MTPIDFKSIKIVSPKYGTYYMLVSPEKYPVVVDRGPQWYIMWDKESQTFYAVRNITTAEGRRSKQYAHRLIMNCPAGFSVAHVDHNGLNNTDENLRIVSQGQINQNKRKHVKSSSKYKGVSLDEHTKKWKAQIMIDGKQKYLGQYAIEQEAHQAYTTAKEQYHEAYVLGESH